MRDNVSCVSCSKGENHKTWSLPCDHREGFYCSCCWCLWCDFGTFQFLQIEQNRNREDSWAKYKEKVTDNVRGRDNWRTWKYREREKEGEGKTHMPAQWEQQSEDGHTNRATRTYIQAENQQEKTYWHAQISVHSLTWEYMDPLRVKERKEGWRGSRWLQLRGGLAGLAGSRDLWQQTQKSLFLSASVFEIKEESVGVERQLLCFISAVALPGRKTYACLFLQGCSL